MKKCNEVMTKNPVCCLPNDIVIKVAELMKKNNIGSIPVIENVQTQKLIGIVTDRDLTLKAVTGHNKISMIGNRISVFGQSAADFDIHAARRWRTRASRNSVFSQSGDERENR